MLGLPLTHVRRRDNLAALMHMAVEVVFWFHPLVWWIGSRMVDERERDCDEEVLRLGNDPQTYAEGILGICEACVRAPLMCSSGITSSNLKGRLEEIIENRSANALSLGRKLVLTVAGLAVIGLPLGIGMLNAPRIAAQGRLPAFEVASVKENKSGSTANRLGYKNGRVNITNSTLEQMMVYAYKIREYQISGPAWIKSARFDVAAKAEEGTPDSELLAMLQTLLTERFNMKLRREPKEMPRLRSYSGCPPPRQRLVQYLEGEIPDPTSQFDLLIRYE